MTRILIDENISEYFAEGLNLVQQPLSNGIEITSIAKEYYKGIDDEEWITLWGKESGIFITQDMSMLKNKSQATLLEENKMGGFFLKPPKGAEYWNKVELVVKSWPKIVKTIQTKSGPYNCIITPRKIERC